MTDLTVFHFQSEIIEIPNPKIQIPNKSQIPIFNDPNELQNTMNLFDLAVFEKLQWA